MDPVDCKWLSTADYPQGAGMTRTPFDDPIAFDRRWVKANPEAKAALTEADPLLFLADHISIYDRREGSVALAITSRDGQSTLAVIPDGPPAPSTRGPRTSPPERAWQQRRWCDSWHLPWAAADGLRAPPVFAAEWRLSAMFSGVPQAPFDVDAHRAVGRSGSSDLAPATSHRCSA